MENLGQPQSICQQENVAFFSFPFSYEAFYMSEKESEGQSLIYIFSRFCLILVFVFLFFILTSFN